MKTRIAFFGTVILLILSLFFYGCEKEKDPADQFVGDYSYTMTVSGDISGSFSEELTVTKTAPDKIEIEQQGFRTNPYTVNGNAIEEDSGQTFDMMLEDGSSIPFTENSTGALVGKVLTINGTWTKTGYNIQAFKIVATKK